MAGHIRRADYFSVNIENKAGEGFRVLSALKKTGVNLLAFFGFPAEPGRARIDLIPSDPEAFLEAVINLDVDLKLSDRKRTFLIQGENRFGAVADHLSKLAEKGINIIAIHAITSGEKRFGMALWVDQAEFERASEILGVS
jgi:hypothetical protein